VPPELPDELVVCPDPELLLLLLLPDAPPPFM
jgi:hypothetical protein